MLLAKNMDEKCKIIQKIGGKFFASLDDYDGPSCLNAIKKVKIGELKPFQKTNYIHIRKQHE